MTASKTQQLLAYNNSTSLLLVFSLEYFVIQRFLLKVFSGYIKLKSSITFGLSTCNKKNKISGNLLNNTQKSSNDAGSKVTKLEATIAAQCKQISLLQVEHSHSEFTKDRIVASGEENEVNNFIHCTLVDD